MIRRETGIVALVVTVSSRLKSSLLLAALAALPWVTYWDIRFFSTESLVLAFSWSLFWVFWVTRALRIGLYLNQREAELFYRGLWRTQRYKIVDIEGFDIVPVPWTSLGGGFLIAISRRVRWSKILFGLGEESFERHKELLDCAMKRYAQSGGLPELRLEVDEEP